MMCAWLRRDEAVRGLLLLCLYSFTVYSVERRKAGSLQPLKGGRACHKKPRLRENLFVVRPCNGFYISIK